MNSELYCGAQARDQTLIFGHVVGGLEVEVDDVLQRLTCRWAENHPSPRTLEGERAIEVHGPRRRYHAGVCINFLEWSRGPLSYEVGEGLTFDSVGTNKLYVECTQLGCPLGHPTGGLTVLEDTL